MLILIAVIVGIILLSKKAVVPVSSNAANTGGTSTPVYKPTPGQISLDKGDANLPELPPFYAPDNASTGSVPKTTLNVGQSGVLEALPLRYAGDRVVSNTSRLPSQLDLLTNDARSIRQPISADSIAADEFTSVGMEQENSFNQVPISESNAIIGALVISKPSTVNAPSAVGSAPYYANNGVPNTLAPTPLPNPTFEKTVTEVASSLVKASVAPSVTPRWLQ